MNNESIERLVHAIDVAVVSLDELIYMLKTPDDLIERIRTTISEIFHSLTQELAKLPDLLVTSSEGTYRRQDLMELYDSVLIKWEFYDLDPVGFDVSSQKFSSLWKIFEEMMRNVEKSGNTFFLSLN